MAATDDAYIQKL